MAPLVSDAAPLLVIVGATGSGKTALSLALAERMNGEIVSCDSVAVYSGMDLGSAKPTAVERARVPHHLLDVVTPAQEFTAGDYGRLARHAVQEIAGKGKLPIVTGGTGLYLRALLDGLSDVPARDEAVRERLRALATRRGGGALFRVLCRFDAATARRIHPNDTAKLIRAIEVSMLSQRPMSASFEQDRPKALQGFRVVLLGLQPERDLLYRRIDERCARMFADGLVEETRGLVAQYGEHCRALGALGYAQARAVLRNEWTGAEAVQATQQGHRNYAKRQGTWFRRDQRVQWLNGFGECCVAEAAERAASL